MAEIEELATKQGEEEARRLRDEEKPKVINVDDLSENGRQYDYKQFGYSIRCTNDGVIVTTCTVIVRLH